MDKRSKKISINLTQEEYDLITWLASHERRSISELAQMILVDNSRMLFLEKQPKGETSIPHFIPMNQSFKIPQL